jgi:hypothetical protein
VVHCRFVLGWTIERTSKALDLSRWRCRDVLRRHSAGAPSLCASGVHRRPRSSTQLTPAARHFLRETLLANPRMYADELAYALWVTRGIGGDKPVHKSRISTAVRAMGMTHKLVRAPEARFLLAC